MALNGAASDYTLPCGRDVETVWNKLEAFDAGLPDRHELYCPHCTAARVSLRSLQVAVDELTHEVAQPPTDLVGRIMSAVRAETRRHDMVPLASQLPHEARISAPVIASVLRFAADTVGGVRARRCRVRAVDAIDGVPAIEVELDIAISYGGLSEGAFDLVRTRVSTAVAARIGVRLARLDIVVADVYDA
ncbi:hypothetical protein [Kibdelosporangium phytohabitans]|uniref:Asp23/Gls24 family envelope stress response protein n=1 Tax=Kibdelosporangium phytohabitans TaxID=860235 RepID=A0A0N9HXB0_9PSEU|nr:hypothetical protein [Kibdelosporangium phytohabitans]ALG09953.1 hypothetical protein AOZ06_26355 [Kibdelosporangium phytohabitans]MBE1468635.1 putative alkaline shock family protein YloU [Kibdelosporangium phytohabitans]